MKYDMEEKMSNGFSFDTTKFVLGEVKKEALKTAMEELAERLLPVIRYYRRKRAVFNGQFE